MLIFLNVYQHFFSLAAKLTGPFPGCELSKNVDFLTPRPLMKISYLRGGEGFLEIVFVGCVRCSFVLNLLNFFFFLAAKLIGPVQGCESFKNIDFLPLSPLQILGVVLIVSSLLSHIFVLFHL